MYFILKITKRFKRVGKEKKVLFLFLVIFLFNNTRVLSALNENEEIFDYLYLSLESGEVIKYRIDRPVSISFNGATVSIDSDSYSIQEIRKYSFSDPTVETGINEISTTNSIEIIGNKIILGNDFAVEQLSISDLSGISYQIPTITSTKSGYEINVEELSSGTYLLTVGKNTIKFIKK